MAGRCVGQNFRLSAALQSGIYSALMITDLHSFAGRIASVVCALLLAAPVGLAPGVLAQTQSQAAPPPAQQAPAPRPAAPPLRVSTRLVQVSVIVDDKHGTPVTGLTKDDFTLLDGGQPQTIAFFAEESNAVPAVSSAAPAAALPPAHTFSNRFEEKAGVPTSVTVILLDALNTHFTDMAYARNRVKKFLQQLKSRRPRGALWAFRSDLRAARLHAGC